MSAFAEVTRAKHRHDGPVGINVLRKIAMPIPATLDERRCDPGYIRQSVADDGRLVYVCPTEPEPTLKSKGAQPRQATGRVCLCNALLAAAGLPQHRRDGYVEAAIFTGGADLDAVRRLSPDGRGYSAAAVMAHIRAPRPGACGEPSAAADVHRGPRAADPGETPSYTGSSGRPNERVLR